MTRQCSWYHSDLNLPTVYLDYFFFIRIHYFHINPISILFTNTSFLICSFLLKAGETLTTCVLLAHYCQVIRQGAPLIKS